MAPLFMEDDEDLQGVIRDHVILPHLFGDFHPCRISNSQGRGMGGQNGPQAHTEVHLHPRHSATA
jgi:hypothetical protein